MMYNEIRRKTKKIRIGDIYVGGDATVKVQSMTNTDSEDFDATYGQIKRLEAAGCEIIRMTVPTMEAAAVLGRLKASDIAIPIVADIHFDYRLAIAAAKAGADKIRINPGNIGDLDRVKAVVEVCREREIPIRIGVNSGSLDKKILAKYGAPTGEALAESAMENIAALEHFGFDNTIVAIKSSDVGRMIRANEIVAASCDYPIHLGVTEAGGDKMGSVKSAVGIGSMLTRGIGDTLRVSLTADPVLEIERGRAILAALGMDSRAMINVVSCPTCGRTKIDLIGLSSAFEARMDELHPSRPVKVAIMGCVVNGPGEAGDADIGIAGGNGEAVLFCHGKILRKLPEASVLDALIEEINRL